MSSFGLSGLLLMTSRSSERRYRDFSHTTDGACRCRRRATDGCGTLRSSDAHRRAGSYHAAGSGERSGKARTLPLVWHQQADPRQSPLLLDARELATRWPVRQLIADVIASGSRVGRRPHAPLQK